jgi:hypothetical protein
MVIPEQEQLQNAHTVSQELPKGNLPKTSGRHERRHGTYRMDRL